MKDDYITFVNLDNTGKVLSQTKLANEAILNCPGFIMVPEHYRFDGTCRHDEPNCEQPNCSSQKLYPEIYCRTHLIELYGEDYVEEVYYDGE